MDGGVEVEEPQQELASRARVGACADLDLELDLAMQRGSDAKGLDAVAATRVMLRRDGDGAKMRRGRSMGTDEVG